MIIQNLDDAVAAALTQKTGRSASAADYEAWLQGDFAEGDFLRFECAVVDLMGADLYMNSTACRCAPQVLLIKLGFELENDSLEGLARNLIDEAMQPAGRP